MSHGKRFETDFRNSLRSMGHWCERFTDRTFGQGGMSVKSPPDLIAIVHFQPWLMELKAQNVNSISRGSIPVNRLNDHQLESLLEFDDDHGKAWVVVMFYEGKRATKRVVYMIPVQYWYEYPELMHRKSVSIQSLEGNRSVIKWRWVGRNVDVGPWVLCMNGIST